LIIRLNIFWSHKSFLLLIFRCPKELFKGVLCTFEALHLSD